MSQQTLTGTATGIEELLDQGKGNSLQTYLAEQAAAQAIGRGLAMSEYQHILVRRNPSVGDEIFGPKSIPIGRYSESELYGVAGSPSSRFRTALRALVDQACRAAEQDPEWIEYAHQTTLFWAEVGRLKEFIGTMPVITAIVAELRTARFQFLAKDTPPAAMRVVAKAIQSVADAPRWDTALVDRFVDILELGGFDSLALDALRASDA